MSPLSIPPELKKISPFIRRAEELDRDTTRPVTKMVAYYCRQHSIKYGIQLSRSREATKCLTQIMDMLEQEKEEMNAFTPEESRSVCRKFAMEIFEKANDADLAGAGTASNNGKGIAKTFNAAANFIDVLKCFDTTNNNDDGDDDENEEQKLEEEERRKYAKWRALEILKAINEGREIPPPPGIDNEENEDEDENGDDNDNDNDSVIDVTPPPIAPQMMDFAEPPQLSVPPSSSAAAVEGTEVDMYGPPPPYVPPPSHDDFDDIPNSTKPTSLSPPPTTTTTTTAKKSSFFGFKVAASPVGKPANDAAALKDAIELTQFALVALENKDAELGLTRLQQAVSCLEKD